MCPSTTNITNTGLGDDQYQQLADNQTGIGEGLDAGFAAGGERFDTVDSGISGLADGQGEIYSAIDTGVGSRDGVNPLYADYFANFSGNLGTASSEALRMSQGMTPQDLQYDVNGDGVVDVGDAQLLMDYSVQGQGTGTGLYGEFDAQNRLIQGQGRTLTGLGSQLSDVSSGIGANQSSLTNLQGDVTGGFDTMGTRFDTVDTANTGMQTAIDQGFLDQTQGFSDLTGTVGEGFANAQTARDANLGTMGDNVLASTDATNQALNTVSGDILAGQGTLTNDLSGLGTTLDTYGGQIMDDQSALANKQDTFQSNLDNYVDRYDDDVTLANSSRADIQSGMTNELGRMREDLGVYAQAAATGNDALGRQITDTSAANAANIDTLSSDIEGGFSQQTADQAVAQENLSTNLTDVRGLLLSTGDDLDETTRSQYQSLVNSFDSNGTLIENAIDDQGNTITRALDDQNNVIETKFDSAGNEISKVGMNVDTMLTNAQTYKNDLSSQITTSSNDAMSQISTGFQAGNTEQMKQTRDLANVASGMSELDINMRQDFNQIGKAFDNSGQLIQNSIEENGNTISRAVDKNGMLLLRRFDVTGNSLGDKVINLSRAYTNLNSISMPGSNSSMGNLTAARTGEVANSGFMSPYQST